MGDGFEFINFLFESCILGGILVVVPLLDESFFGFELGDVQLTEGVLVTFHLMSGGSVH